MTTLTSDEKTTLSVLAFLFFRMGMDEKALRVYEALSELSEADSADRRFAKAGEAALLIEAGQGEAALAALREALPASAGAVSTKDAGLLLLKARALWLADRKAEAEAVRDEYLHLAGSEDAAL